jgi:glycosyltransferase involved in cell wall biosynthesis
MVIIGPPTAEQYYAELRGQIVQAGLEQNFTVIPGLPADSQELLSAYQSADIFILPSLHEPFGIVALEAWSAGLPVIAADVGGLGRLVEDGKTGLLFNPNSLDTLMAAWERLRNDPSLSADLKNNAGKIVLEKYSWQTVTGELLNFYHKAIEFHARKK